MLFIKCLQKSLFDSITCKHLLISMSMENSCKKNYINVPHNVLYLNFSIGSAPGLEKAESSWSFNEVLSLGPTALLNKIAARTKNKSYILSATLLGQIQNNFTQMFQLMFSTKITQKFLTFPKPKLPKSPEGKAQGKLL